MSSRAAWRLESLGFGCVFDYVAGKQDWFASRLPREGRRAGIPHAGDVADRTVPTCNVGLIRRSPELLLAARTGEPVRALHGRGAPLSPGSEGSNWPVGGTAQFVPAVSRSAGSATILGIMLMLGTIFC